MPVKPGTAEVTFPGAAAALISVYVRDTIRGHENRSAAHLFQYFHDAE
jgi:hypothetical protein